MKRWKLFPKLFLYTLGIMLLVVFSSHGLIYLLAPQMQLSFSSREEVVVSIDQAKMIAGAVTRALPLSLGGSLLIAAVCSLLLSKAITDPIRQISAATDRMRRLDGTAGCAVCAKDEIGTLAQNVNDLYAGLLSTIRHLEQEKQTVRELERAKADFLRAASHELKTPVTALNATLENMILGVGKYRDYDTYLPACKEMAQQLSGMIREILEASRSGAITEQPQPVDVCDLLAELCEPYRMIAAAHQIAFSLKLPERFPAILPAGPFRKAVSNVLANAVAYTESGGAVSVYLDGRSLVVENEGTPIPPGELRRLFEPFYRPDFSRSSESGGNGLGLYLVDTLLTAMEFSYSFAPMDAPLGMRFTIWL